MLTWAHFGNYIESLLTARGVPRDVAAKIATEIQGHCHRFLFYKEHPPRLPGLDALVAAEPLAVKLHQKIQLGVSMPRWSRADRDELMKHLARFVAAVHTLQQGSPRHRRGPKGDPWRRDLEDAIAKTLIEHNVRVTKAKSGTFARVLEEVHAVVGISERGVEKAVRSACDRVSRASRKPAQEQRPN
jgi:hypothetical protein